MPAAFLKPLTSVGAFYLDGALSQSSSYERIYSERRTAAGARISEHSEREPTTHTFTGLVSQIHQPQNVFRPRPGGLERESIFVGRDRRLLDRRSLLLEIIEQGDAVEVVEARATKFQAVVISIDVDSQVDRDSYTIELRELHTYGGMGASIQPPDEVAAIIGSGETINVGSSGVS